MYLLDCRLCRAKNYLLKMLECGEPLRAHRNKVKIVIGYNRALSVIKDNNYH